MGGRVLSAVPALLGETIEAVKNRSSRGSYQLQKQQQCWREHRERQELGLQQRGEDEESEDARIATSSRGF